MTALTNHHNASGDLALFAVLVVVLVAVWLVWLPLVIFAATS